MQSIRIRSRRPQITSPRASKRSTSAGKPERFGREFARLHGIEKPYYATPGDGIFHFYFPEQGLVVPGQFIPGADSHSRACGAYGAMGMGVGSTTLGFGWATGYVYFTLAKARRVVFSGTLPRLKNREGRCVAARVRQVDKRLAAEGRADGGVHGLQLGTGRIGHLDRAGNASDFQSGIYGQLAADFYDLCRNYGSFETWFDD